MQDKGQKVQAALSNIIKSFESGDIPKAMALAVNPTILVPSSDWSLLNRVLMAIAGTADARGFRQWKEVDRYVKAGSKAFYILAPKIKKGKKENEEGQEEETTYLAGFVAVPVFRAEDTQGKALEYEELELPPLPLLPVAKAWGIDTRPVSGHMGFYGRFSPMAGKILLASPEECVFFHELAHAADNRIRKLKGGQHWDQEIVAELSAAVLCRMVGKKPENLGQNYKYIAHYAEKAKKDPVKACLEVFAQTEKVLNLILNENKETMTNTG